MDIPYSVVKTMIAFLSTLLFMLADLMLGSYFNTQPTHAFNYLLLYFLILIWLKDLGEEEK